VNYGFVIDNRKCIGCHACTIACKAEHEIPLGVNRTWVKYIEKGAFPDARRFFSVLRCNHCADAPCVTICPVTALFAREDGIVDFDPNRCIGCKACIQGCPYDALYIDPDSHTAAKCNYCAHRVEVGLEPPCAVVCPEHAIVAGDLDDPASEIAGLVKLQKVTVRKPEKGTQPKVFYIDGDRASLVPGEAAVEGAYVFSQGREHGVTPGAPAGGGDGVVSDEIWDRVRAVMGEKAVPARRVYDAGQTHRDSWGWKVSAYLWSKSIAAGCLMIYPFVEAYASLLVVTALGFLAVTGVLLVADLKRPSRFLWVLTRPQWRSWLTRGSYLLLAFGLIGSAALAAFFFDLERLRLVLGPPAVAVGALTAVYTAFLFWQSKGRDLWQSPLLPLHLLVQALLAGLSALLVLRPAVAPGPLPPPEALEGWLQAFLALNAALILAELFAVHQTEDASAAARWARRGPRLQLLVWGILVAGHALPFFLLALTGGRDGAPIAALAGLLALAGLALYEHLYVRAGQSVALS